MFIHLKRWSNLFLTVTTFSTARNMGNNERSYINQFSQYTNTVVLFLSINPILLLNGVF